MRICDVCYGDTGTVTPSTHNIWHKSGSFKVTLEVCQRHRGLFKGNTFEVNESIAHNTMVAVRRRES